MTNKESSINIKVYQAVIDTDQILTNIERHLEANGMGNNVIIGNRNSVDGDDNTIIGNGISIKGNDNWVIDRRGFQGHRNNFLIFKNWSINLDKIHDIRHRPHKAIRKRN